MVGRTEEPPKAEEVNKRPKEGRKNNKRGDMEEDSGRRNNGRRMDNGRREDNNGRREDNHGRRYPPRSNGYSDTHDYQRRDEFYPPKDSKYRKDSVGKEDQNDKGTDPMANGGASRKKKEFPTGNYRTRNNNKPRFAKQVLPRSKKPQSKAEDNVEVPHVDSLATSNDIPFPVLNVDKLENGARANGISSNGPKIEPDKPTTEPIKTSIIEELKLLGVTDIKDDSQRSPRNKGNESPRRNMKGNESPRKVEHQSPRKRNSSSSRLIEELKILGEELSESKTGQVLEQLKSGEKVELEVLKELYDGRPDVATEIVDSTTEGWVSSILPLEQHNTPLVPSDDQPTPIVSLEDRSTPNVPTAQIEIDSGVEGAPTRGVCCGCYPPMYHPAHCMPVPHPGYYYPMWNIHHPMPPPPVHRLASAPSLPASDDGGFVHKRYITRSARTPGTIVFTLFSTDNLRIVSVRCDDPFIMTADLCNEEGEKVAENFYLHTPDKPKLWDQYAFSGNHSINFTVTSADDHQTTVVVTFMHEITVK